METNKTSSNITQTIENQPISSFKSLVNKKVLIFQLIIAIMTSWISATFSFLPSIFFIQGFPISDIFESYGFGHLLVGGLSILMAVLTKKPKKKTNFSL
ncbi:MAG: hypothetical protein K9W44_08745 [Candidatus Lokiarchaeota archaeon]|nr:hypothetical protein [Candidatus Harpocratesius repetitus]